MIGILVWIIVGAIAGFVASKVLSGAGMGLLWDISGRHPGCVPGWLARESCRTPCEPWRSPSEDSYRPSWARSSSWSCSEL